MEVDGPLIRKLRKADEWSGTAFANEIGISPQYLSDIERGRRGAPLPLVKKMAAVLEIPTRSLRLAAEDKPKNDVEATR